MIPHLSHIPVIVETLEITIVGLQKYALYQNIIQFCDSSESLIGSTVNMTNFGQCALYWALENKMEIPQMMGNVQNIKCLLYHTTP
jgi:hypothetical protein